MLKEFREFAMRGSVVDLAVGVVIGGAFGKVVSSLVKDLIMPPVGLLTGGVDFTNLFVNLSAHKYATLAEAQTAGAPTLNVGLFINAVVDFVIVAFAIFMVVRQMNKLKKQPAPADPTTRDCPQCLMSIPLRATRCGHCTSPVG